MWALWLGNNIYSILFYIWCKFPPCTFAMRRTLISFCLIISSLNVLSTPALDEWHCSYACTSTVVMGRTLDLPSVIELAPWTYKMVYCYFGVQKKLSFIYLFFFYFYFLGPIWLGVDFTGNLWMHQICHRFFFFTFLAVLHYWRLLAECRIKFSYT